MQFWGVCYNTMVVEVLNKTLVINVPPRGLYGELIYVNTSYSMPMAVTKGHCLLQETKQVNAKNLKFPNNIISI